MIDINKQIDFWCRGATEDFEVARELILGGRTRHGLFLLHLSLEKMLKAFVCRQSKDLAPRIHNLVRLTELAGLSLDQNQIDTLAELNAFNIEGRYPDTLSAPLPQNEARAYMLRTEEIFTWLTNQL